MQTFFVTFLKGESLVKLEIKKWGDTVEKLKQLALSSEHYRSRERFFALYSIASGASATQVAVSSQRNHQTVMSWVKQYNICGSSKLVYQRSGGHPGVLKKLKES